MEAAGVGAYAADAGVVGLGDAVGEPPLDGFRGPEADCFDQGGNLFVAEPVVVAGEDDPLDGCLDYDPCAYDGTWGLRSVQRWSCENQDTLIGILAFIGSLAAGSFCAILAGPVGWAVAGAAGGACGGMAYRYMDNARNDRGLWDGVFDPKAIAIDAAIGIAVAGVFRGIGVRWARAKSGSKGGAGPAGAAAQADDVVVIGKVADLKATQLRQGERTLLDQLSHDLGSPRANYIRNDSVLRREMGRGVKIRDVSIDRRTGALRDETGFLRAERDILRDHGWSYDPKTGYWYPP